MTIFLKINQLIISALVRVMFALFKRRLVVHILHYESCLLCSLESLDNKVCEYIVSCQHPVEILRRALIQTDNKRFKIQYLMDILSQSLLSSFDDDECRQTVYWKHCHGAGSKTGRKEPDDPETGRYFEDTLITIKSYRYHLSWWYK